MATQSPNYRFVIETAVRLAEPAAARILDYGCGNGTLLGLAAEEGVPGEFWGADTFDGFYTQWRESVEPTVADRIRKIENGVLPFEDASFDVVVSNQVSDTSPIRRQL